MSIPQKLQNIQERNELNIMIMTYTVVTVR